MVLVFYRLFFKSLKQPLLKKAGPGFALPPPQPCLGGQAPPQADHHPLLSDVCILEAPGLSREPQNLPEECRRVVPGPPAFQGFSGS